MSTFKCNKGFVFSQSEFPEINGANIQLNTEPFPEKKTFIEAISEKKDETPVPLLNLKRGWVCMSKDEHGNTVSTKDINKSDSEEEITPRSTIKKLELHRERFKERFIELNGEDEYDKIYVNYPQCESSDEDVGMENNASDDEHFDVDNQDEYDDYVKWK